MKDLLVLRLSALGDVIHTLPAVTMLRDAIPGRTVSWAVEAAYAALVEIAGGVRPISVRMRRWGRSPIASRTAIREAVTALRGHEVSVDFQGLVKSAALARLSGAGVRFGFGRDAIREKLALRLNNRHVSVDAGVHVVEQNLELGARVVSALEGAAPALPSPADLVPAFSRFAADPDGRLAPFAGVVVLLPGAGKPNKLWAADRFRELVRKLGSRAVVAWGPGERPLAEAIGGRIAPETDLRELAWLLLHAEAVVGGDTGPLHLAAALGTRVVGLYGPTDPRRNGPWGQVHRCVDHFGTSKCMDSISVEEVVRGIEKAVAE